MQFWRKKPESIIVRFLMRSVDLCCQFYIPLISLAAAVAPTYPWNIFFVLTSQVFEATILLQFITFLLNLAFWQIIMHIIILSLVVNFVLAIFILKCSISSYQRKTENLHNAGCDDLAIESHLKLYRQIQLLAGQYNFAHRGKLIVGVTSGISFGFIAYTYLLLAHFNHLEFTAIGFCAAGSFCGMILTVVAVRFPASVYRKCTEAQHHTKVLTSAFVCLPTCQTFQAQRKNKFISWLKKYQASCPAIKIRIGDNFFDSFTPLVILQFCINQTIALILVG